MKAAPAEKKGKRVAVVGSGSAGLTVAIILAQNGYDVTIFERKHLIGGMLRYGIPEFRLPKSVLDRYQRLLADVEVLDISKKTGLSVEAVKRLMFCWISCKECGMIQLFHPFGGVLMANLMKKEIKTTFLRLLEERPYHQITVKEIVKECGINRNSFYYHYADLPALVEEVIDEEIGRFVREQNSFSSMEESLTDALSFFREHKRAAYHVYNSVNRDIFDRYLMKNCESVSIGYVNSILANTPLSEDDLQAIIHFNAYVCYGAVTRWLESGMTYDLHEDFRRMFQLMIEPAMKQQGMTVEPLK